MPDNWRDQLLKFARLRLGLKPVIDYVQGHRKLLGVANLPIRTIFDIGANVGRKARQYRRVFPDAQIYCFEPVPTCYRQLDRWARRQRGKVTAFNLALGSAPGDAEIKYRVDRPHGASLVHSPEREGCSNTNVVSLPVRVETLDTVAAGLPIEDGIFVKIDVEGFDLEVLAGGQSTMRRAAAAVVEVALDPRPPGWPAFAEYVRIMTELGYEYRGNLAYAGSAARAVDAVFIRPRCRSSAG